MFFEGRTHQSVRQPHPTPNKTSPTCHVHCSTLCQASCFLLGGPYVSVALVFSAIDLFAGPARVGLLGWTPARNEPGG